MFSKIRAAVFAATAIVLMGSTGHATTVSGGSGVLTNAYANQEAFDDANGRVGNIRGNLECVAARLGSGLLGQTVVASGTPTCARALVASDRDHPPDPIRHRLQFGSVAGG